MLQRIIWGAFYGIVMISVLWLGIPVLVYLLLLGIAVFCVHEYFDMASITYPDIAGQKIWYKLISIAVIIGFFAWAFISKAKFIMPGFLFYVVPLTAFFLFISELFFAKQSKSLLGVAIAVFGILYAASAPIMALAVALPSNFLNSDFSLNSKIVLFVFALIWTCDTMQYFSGKMLGRTKLFERVSPNKTWEGAVGGVIFTIAVAYLFSLFQNQWTTTQWMMIGGLVAVFSILGDLVESLLKRQAGIKDSGNFLPGHGGALDRFDSFLIVMPVVYLFLSWFVN